VHKVINRPASKKPKVEIVDEEEITNIINYAEIDVRSTNQSVMNFHAKINQTMNESNMTLSMIDDSREMESLGHFNNDL